LLEFAQIEAKGLFIQFYLDQRCKPRSV